jgi:hypothetical protein
VFNWFKSIFSPARPSGPPETIRMFRATDPILSQDSVMVEADGWLVDAEEGQVIRLFEIPDPGVERCLLIYRATMKSESLDGRAYLEMWCRLSGRGEFFSKGLNQPLRGNTDWASYEILFYLKKGQRPELIKLNLAIEGRGKIWLKDIQVLKTPL